MNQSVIPTTKEGAAPISSIFHELCFFLISSSLNASWIKRIYYLFGSHKRAAIHGNRIFNLDFHQNITPQLVKRHFRKNGSNIRSGEYLLHETSTLSFT